MKFAEFKLHENVLKGTRDAGFIECMPVQEKTFAQTLIGRDVCVQSQTGTGKTAAFLISIFQLLLFDDAVKGKKALVIAPTRELALQIEKEAQLLGSNLDFSIGCFYGGVSYSRQEKLLRDGVNILIGTPGRLLDFSRQNKLHFNDIGIVIIDEADRLFDMGFLPDIRRMLRQMPPFSKRRSMLFSATLGFRIKELAWEFMNDPAEIEIKPEQITVEEVSQELYHVGQDEKMSLLLGILKRDQPKNALIFTNTKNAAHEVAKRLEHNGYNCQYIVGDLPQQRRQKIIEETKSGKINFLVATEVAARGLHIDDLELVVNYDLPEDCENYIHRIGRTARAGKSGKAISLVCDKYVFGLEAIESFAKIKIPVESAHDELFEKDKSAGMHFSRERYKAGRPLHRSSHSKAVSPFATKHSPHKRSTHSTVPTAKGHRQHTPKKYAPSQTSFQEAAGVKHHPKRMHPRKHSHVPPEKSRSQKERLEYYKKKYGDDFKAGPERPIEVKQEKKSLLKRMLRLVGLK